MWVFAVCQEYLSSSEIFWNKYKVDHDICKSSSSFPESEHREQCVFNCTCVCVYVVWTLFSTYYYKVTVPCSFILHNHVWDTQQV